MFNFLKKLFKKVPSKASDKTPEPKTGTSLVGIHTEPAVIQKFFEEYRKIFGAVRVSQVQGIEFLFKKFHHDSRLSLAQQAYLWATVRHETASTYKPISEYGKGNGRRYGRPDGITGKTYYGRGYVQLTWKFNYLAIGKLLDIDLVDQPELAKDPYIAYEIMVVGMLKGIFTGNKLSDFINSTSTDYVQARRVVNGLDRADMIAASASHFERLLRNL